MDYNKISLVMREVLSMNGGEFLYSVDAHALEADRITLSASVKDTKVGNTHHVYTYSFEDCSELIKKVHDASQKLVEEREEYRQRRINELEKLRGEI